MAWYVLTEDDLEEIENNENGDKLKERLLEGGKWSEDDTLVVNPSGIDHMKLTGAFSKLPRGFGPSPPMNTKPLEKL